MKSLHSGLRKDGFNSFSDLIYRITSESDSKRCSDPYCEFLSEISRNTPACGLLQFGEKGEIIKPILRQIVSNSIDIFDSANFEQLSTLQACIPILTAFIAKCPKIEGKLPEDVCDVIRCIVATVDATFEAAINPFPCYQATISTSNTSFFPSLPIVRGKGSYKMGSNSPTQDDDCRKASYGHPTLTPGIFTVYCPHGVCYGFEVMRRCESPKVPFDIFTLRFRSPPAVIIYDNACKLHAYCLNCEPRLYQKAFLH